jgi:hypothetical protein
MVRLNPLGLFSRTSNPGALMESIWSIPGAFPRVGG